MAWRESPVCLQERETRGCPSCVSTGTNKHDLLGHVCPGCISFSPWGRIQQEQIMDNWTAVESPEDEQHGKTARNWISQRIFLIQAGSMEGHLVLNVLPCSHGQKTATIKINDWNPYNWLFVFNHSFYYQVTNDNIQNLIIKHSDTVTRRLIMLNLLFSESNANLQDICGM